MTPATRLCRSTSSAAWSCGAVAGRPQWCGGLDQPHGGVVEACPDLDDWPGSWQVEPEDIVVGQQIVRALTPFLLHRLDRGLAKATVRRHRNKHWLLGAELIRCRYDDDELARQDVRDAIRQQIGRDGGPLMWARITESEQDSLDATCRKLNRFVSE